MLLDDDIISIGDTPGDAAPSLRPVAALAIVQLDGIDWMTKRLVESEATVGASKVFFWFSLLSGCSSDCERI